MIAPLDPPTASVVQLLDAVARTPWPTHLARCDRLWGPLGIHLDRQITLPPGHENELIHEVDIPLEVTSTARSSRPVTKPSNLGCFLYRNETEDADEQTKLAFDAIAEAMTETWETDNVGDRTPEARVWEVNSLVIERLRPRSPRSSAHGTAARSCMPSSRAWTTRTPRSIARTTGSLEDA